MDKNLTTYEGKNFFGGTTPGLKKKTNEDTFSFTTSDQILKFALADGHWGSEAAKTATSIAKENASNFPDTKTSAIKFIKTIETNLFNQFGKPEMDPEKDQTPETSALFFELNQQKLKVINYGDCRLLVIRNGQVIYQMPTKPTWLGAFSRLQLRNRQSVAEATLFEEIELQKNDVVLAYTDGVDECVYQVPTINVEELAMATQNKAPIEIFNQITDQVFKHGAEDNVSLIVIRV